MLTLKGTCPHCGSANGFKVFGISPCSVRNSGGEMVRYSLAGICDNCAKPVTCSCESLPAEYRETGARLNESGEGALDRTSVLEIFPKPAPAYAHRSIPGGINRAFASIQKMLMDVSCPSPTIVSACRGLLARAVSALGLDGNADLRGQMGELFRRGLITASLNDWAEILDPSICAQRQICSSEDAAELAAFTRMFLRTAFEMPRQIAASQRSRETGDNIGIMVEDFREEALSA